jgi:hypothetical protein
MFVPLAVIWCWVSAVIWSILVYSNYVMWYEIIAKLWCIGKACSKPGKSRSLHAVRSESLVVWIKEWPAYEFCKYCSTISVLWVGAPVQHLQFLQVRATTWDHHDRIAAAFIWIEPMKVIPRFPSEGILKVILATEWWCIPSENRKKRNRLF